MMGMAGRPRSFDRDVALDVAMQHFWRDGYDDTTIADLTRDMGISAPSLYAAFGDKDDLFAASASCYLGTALAGLADALALPTAQEAVVALVRASAAGYTDTATPLGCFVLSEPRLVDERVDMTARIRTRIEQGQRDGDVPASPDPASLATCVIALLSGLSSRARDGGSASELAAASELFLRVLGPQLRT